MARKANDVELVISAKNESEKAFKSVTDALKEIEAAAKKGGGLADLFQGFEARLATVSARQKEFNKLIGDAKSIQKAITNAEKFTKVVQEQEAALAGAQKQLSELESTYGEVEKAANAARAPSEKLAKSLQEQEAKQVSLAQAIAKTRAEIERSNGALAQNAGLDDKAAAAVAKQRQAVLNAGTAWRQITQEISKARQEIVALGAQRTNLQAALSSSVSNKSNLENELRTLKEFIRESNKLARSSGVGESTKALTASARQRVLEVESMLKAERQLQASLTNDISKTGAALRRQEQSFEKLTAKAGLQKKAYDGLKIALTQFEASVKGEGVERQQKNIERLNKTLQTLQANYDTTSARVASATSALSKASTPDPKAVAQFEALRAKIEAAREAVVRERTELDKLNLELREAGVNTDALAARQKELDAVTERLTAEEARLTQEMKELGDQAARTGTNVRKTGANFLQLGRDTRQSLSYLQRIRGELLSIAATYSGVYAVGGAIRSIYDASVQLNKAQARFSVFFNGDAERVAQEIAFVTKTAKDLKIEVEGTLDQYSKFVSGLDESQIPLENIRKTFIGFATAGRVGRLSAEELERVFNALTQIFGKQQLQTEELKGQLADALPGAVKRTADALKLGENGVAKLTEAMKQGNVSSEAAILLANELYKVYGSQLPTALKGPDAAFADFKNTIRDLKLEIGNSGFIETLTDGLREATEAIKSNEFRQGAKDMANLLGQIVKVGVALVQNFDKVKTILQLVFTVKIIGFVNELRLGIVGIGIGVAKFGSALTKVLPIVGAATKSIGLLVARVASLPVILAGVGSFSLGTWLYDEFRVVKKFGALLVANIESTVVLVKAAFERLKAYTSMSGEERQARLKEINEQVNKDVANIAKILDDTFSAINDGLLDEDKPKILDPEQEKKNAEKIVKDMESLFTDAQIDGLLDKALSNKDVDKKMDTLRTKVKDALQAIDTEIQQKSGDTLEVRLAAIRGEYAKLLRQIEQAGGSAQFPNAASSIDQIVAIKQVEETEKEINRLIQERRTLISSINEQAELGAITVEQATQRINAENARLIPQMQAALAQAKQIAATINSAPINQSVNGQDELVALEQQRAKREQLLALENEINRVMSIRAERIQTINALVEVGDMTETRGRSEILQLNRSTKLELDAIVQSATKMAETLGDEVLIERLKQVNIELSKVNEQIVTADQFNEQFASGATDALDSFISGTQSAGDALRTFFADMLRWLARAIIQWAILKAIQNSGWGGAVSGAVSSGVNHTGGIVGQAGVRRRMPVTAFAGAVRYHSGGIAGLKPNEMPTILEKGEEVLTRNDPRHQANGGGSGSTPLQVKIVNAIDSTSVLKEALNSAAGQKVLVNAMQANKSSIKSVLT